MQIRTDIENINGRYNVQVSTTSFSAQEEEKLRAFGEPLVEVGGSFGATVSRPGQTNTVLSIYPVIGNPASLLPVIASEIISSVSVIDPGEGYTSALISVAGDGVGASLTPLFGMPESGISAAGTHYAVAEILTLTTLANSGQKFQVRVTGVSGAGVGGVTSFEVITPGAYAEVPDPSTALSAWTGSAAGTNFAVLSSGKWGLTSVTVASGGSGYHVVPTTVAFELPTMPVRLRSDFPVKQIFDLLDSPDADVMAKVWSDEVVYRATTAKQVLLRSISQYSGTTVSTV